ncbi:hypothetical protein C6P45_003007 [Maudiozyma exigua]|uniref:Uncharacterized protein n=1 Tax=Maudiozyma exigua TaxID=34358 RepID=A0A9P6WEM6_MAUEX|nr:hypothetical protein C6P45_003007 [Kazachstania exigua]
MDIRSPLGSAKSPDPSDSVILTPFKERALEEQRLRDRLILSLTPGLKRQHEVRASVEPLNNDIFEIRSYLQDLSSALASRGAKNLTSQLLQSHSDVDDIDNVEGQTNNETESDEIQDRSFNSRANTFNNADESILGKEIEQLKNARANTSPVKRHIDTDEGGVQDEGSMDIIDSPTREEQVKINDTEQGMSEEALPMTLSQQILSKIPRQRVGTKIRKLEPVSINGVTNPAKEHTAIKSQNDITSDHVKNPFVNDSPQYEQPIPTTFDIDMEPNFPADTDDMGPDLPIENSDYNLIASPESRIRQRDEGQNVVVSPPLQPTSYYGSDELINFQQKIKPLGIKKLQDIFQNFMRSNDIKIRDKTWKTIQDASSTIVQKMANDLDNGSGLLIPKRTKIIELLQKYQVIPLDATDSEIFAICSPYLTVEEMNELEIDWFS